MKVQCSKCDAPVEVDGSAHFNVPADTFVYFQLLDEKRMMVQTMRSGTIVRPGETTGCAGCHEERRSTISTANLPAAMRRAPSRLTPWYGPARMFNYLAEVQPVFDKHCVSCHDYGKETGKKLNLAADRTTTFNTAYVELWRKGYIKCIGGGPAEIQPAYSWGAHASRLIQVLRTPNYPGHEKLELDPEELDRLITWVDLNGVYYPTYASAYPMSLTGRVPLEDGQLARLAQLTGWLA